MIDQVLRRLQEIEHNVRCGIMDVMLESAESSLPNLTATVCRVNRYIAEERFGLAATIVERELSSLPESVEILSRIKNVSIHGTQTT